MSYLVLLRRFQQQNRDVLGEKDRYRDEAMLYRQKHAEQCAIAESLRAADQRKDEEYKKKVDAGFHAPMQLDRTNYLQTRLPFTSRASPPRRQRLEIEQKEDFRGEYEGSMMAKFAGQIAQSMASQQVSNRESTKAMLEAFAASQDTMNKTIVLVILVDKSGPGIIRRHI